MDLTPPAARFRWSDLDQTLASPKLSKLTAEMQEAFFRDEAEISFEGRKRGNSAYFLPTFLDRQVQRTDEWARREYEIYCECVYEQGHCITPEFVRDIYEHAIKLLIHVRKSSIASYFSRRAHLTGERLNQHCLNKFAREMDILSNTWLRTLEADARSLEHNSYYFSSIPPPGSLPQLRQAIVDCDSRLTAVNVEIAAQKQALAMASANGGPVSKILQAIRKLSVAKANLEAKRRELEQILADFGKKIEDTGESEPPKRRRPPRARALCFEAAIALLSKKPHLSLVQFCREMDSNAEKFRSAPKYRPPESWETRTFYEQYQKRANTVSRFVSAVRSEIARRVKKTV